MKCAAISSLLAVFFCASLIYAQEAAKKGTKEEAKPAAKASPSESKAAPEAKSPVSNKATSAVGVKEGKVLVVRGVDGGEAQLTDNSDKKYLLSGEWRDELLRLDGHKVQVWGQPAPKKLDMPVWRVERYEIVDSGGGRKPLVGVLVMDDQGFLSLQTANGNFTVTAKGLIGKLKRSNGCRVWLLGSQIEKTVNASRFGLLSCKRIKPQVKEEKK